MAKKYSVRIQWTMETFIEVEAENDYHAEQKAMEVFDEDYDLDAPDPHREFVEREDVGHVYLKEETDDQGNDSVLP